MKNFILAIVSGIIIGVGGSVYLALAEKSVVLGATLFTFGLFFILIYQFKLYTGMVGQALYNDKKTNFSMLYVIAGNFIGTFTTSTLLSFTRTYDKILPKALELSETKLNDSWVSVLILAIYCGLLMFLACNTYYKHKDSLYKIIAMFICIIVFTVLGFEHSIANMVYFTLAKAWSLKAVLYTFIALIGNGLGSLFIPAILKLVKRNDF